VAVSDAIPQQITLYGRRWSKMCKPLGQKFVSLDLHFLSATATWLHQKGNQDGFMGERELGS
jgi:hypothetical protein